MKKTTLSTLSLIALSACSGGRESAQAQAPAKPAAARTFERGAALTRRDVLIARTEAANTAKLRRAMGLPVAETAEAPTPDRLTA